MPEDAAYLRIAADLREKITAGEEGYQPGDRIPGESDLAEMYDVARATARQALGRMKQEGLVTAVKGSGTRVRRTPPCRRLSTDRFSREHRERGRGAYDVELRDLGYQGRTQWLALGKDKASKEVADMLGVRKGSPVMVRARLMFAAPKLPDGKVDYENEEVMQVATSYIPWGIAEGTPITEEDTGPGGLYSRIEDAGHRLARFAEEVAVRIGSDEECELLKLDPASLVLTLDRQAFDESDTVVEICRHVMPPTYYVISYGFPAT
jgi:GntR family transcriptional regulator